LPVPAPTEPETTWPFAPQTRRVPVGVREREETSTVIERRATVVWDGDLQNGSGRVTTRTSEVLVSMPVTWASRVEDAQGLTSPEELLAAAHAACYAMSVAGALARAGSPAEQLEVEATCELDRGDAGLRIAAMRLSVAATGVEPDGLREATEVANERCPVSNALRGNVDITVETRVLDEAPVPSEAPTDPTRAA
jgi:osmotically inducible protein OsmC